MILDRSLRLVAPLDEGAVQLAPETSLYGRMNEQAKMISDMLGASSESRARECVVACYDSC
jgi:hypothetical protein